MEAFVKVAAAGTQATTGGSSATTAIPNTADGRRAKIIRLQALANCYVKPVVTSGTCTVNDILLSPNEALYLDVTGYTHIAHLQETAAAKFNITPIEF